jgi:DNA-binding beta-propeller fold protein YncE
VAVAANGSVFVADFWNQRIQVFNPDGKYLRSWSVPDWTPHAYDEPYLSVDPASGNLLATDPTQRQALEFTPGGRLLGSISGSSLVDPIGVAALPGGRVAISDASANNVTVFAVARPATSPRRGTSRPAGTAASRP